MKIAHLATIDVGVRLLLLNQLCALQAQGHEVHAICRDGPLVAEVRAAGIVVHTIPFQRRITPLDDLRALWQLVGLFRRERYQLIHTHTPKASLLGQWAGLLARIPLRIHTIHGLYLPHTMSWKARQFYTWIERITMTPAQRVLSVNREDVGTVIKYRMCSERRVRYLGNGIDIETFDPSRISAQQRAQTRAALQIPPDHRIIGIVGRLVAEKGFLEFFEAAAQLNTARPKLTFLCIGPDEPEKADGLSQVIRQQAATRADIRFLGLRRDMDDLYAIMDVLVHPSHREGFPRVPMEAAAMGLPMVLSNIRGCREIVTHEENGLLVPAKDSTALAEATLRLLDDPDLARRFGAAAREKALREYDERTIFATINQLYADLAQQEGR